MEAATRTETGLSPLLPRTFGGVLLAALGLELAAHVGLQRLAQGGEEQVGFARVLPQAGVERFVSRSGLGGRAGQPWGVDVKGGIWK